VASKAALVWTPDLISAQTGDAPEYLVGGGSDAIFVAKWRHARSRILVADAAHHLLLYHAAGTAPLLRVVNGRISGRGSRPGSSTFIPHNGATEWQIAGECVLMHVYIDPGILTRFCQECRFTGDQRAIGQFFAVEDSWLGGFFQMLMSDLEIYKDPSGQSVSLLLNRLKDLLLQHLVLWYSKFDGHDAYTSNDVQLAQPLRPVLLRRVADYVDAHLADPIRLANLAELACMCEDHFIRAFRAATGKTPYRFVLEKRLDASRHLLGTANYSISEVARRTGFGSASYLALKFHRRYGITPTRYREMNQNTYGAK
jgi:AraC family transcriptional regulator